jgi:hypothetical protein
MVTLGGVVPGQYAPPPVIVDCGRLITSTLTELDDVQPLVAVAVTVYVVLATGVATGFAIFALFKDVPLFHVKFSGFRKSKVIFGLIGEVTDEPVGQLPEAPVSVLRYVAELNESVVFSTLAFSEKSSVPIPLLLKHTSSNMLSVPFQMKSELKRCVFKPTVGM